MKVEVKEKEVNGYEYPCLMKCEKYGIIVLFISDKCGTCIIDNVLCLVPVHRLKLIFILDHRERCY